MLWTYFWQVQRSLIPCLLLIIYSWFPVAINSQSNCSTLLGLDYLKIEDMWSETDFFFSSFLQLLSNQMDPHAFSNPLELIIFFLSQFPIGLSYRAKYFGRIFKFRTLLEIIPFFISLKRFRQPSEPSTLPLTLKEETVWKKFNCFYSHEKLVYQVHSKTKIMINLSIRNITKT